MIRLTLDSSWDQQTDQITIPIFSRLTKKDKENRKLTTNNQIVIYRAYILSTLLYCSETWSLYSKQKHYFNVFHFCCLRYILDIKWTNQVPNFLPNNKLLHPVHALLSLLVMSTHCMLDRKIPKYLVTHEKPWRWLHLCLENVGKRYWTWMSRVERTLQTIYLTGGWNYIESWGKEKRDWGLHLTEKQYITEGEYPHVHVLQLRLLLPCVCSVTIDTTLPPPLCRSTLSQDWQMPQYSVVKHR